MCTASEAEAFIEAARAALSAQGAQATLTNGIAEAYTSGAAKIGAQAMVQDLLTSMCDRHEAKPFLFKVAASDWLGNHDLSEEVFGPLGLVVVAKDVDEMDRVARSFAGQLTATLHLDEGGTQLACRLLPVLERKAGRVLANAFPTGVEVCDSMVHGGPYPLRPISAQHLSGHCRSAFPAPGLLSGYPSRRFAG